MLIYLNLKCYQNKMIIYGKAIRHKTLIRYFRIILMCVFCSIALLFLGCSKVEFDPTTFTIKKIFTTNQN